MKEIVQEKIEHDIASAETEEAVNDLRIKYLGRKGKITKALRVVGKLPEKQRAHEGARLNKLKKDTEAILTSRLNQIRSKRLEEETARHYDLSRPGITPRRGHLHPVEQLQKDVVELFWQLGFQVADGPEIETEWYCFEALNIGPDHPARDMQDTFYLENGAVPRTHTSSVQIRYMENNAPPIRVIAPGKVYRNEDEDATHVWSFRQVEGLVVDEGIRLSDLKGTLEYMLKGLFGEHTELRLRPNYFPYTEPSLEMDASCMMCTEETRQSCRVCKSTGWVELGGAGMVHPQVLRNVGIDPEHYSGFAFGFGLERITAVKYELSDLRDLWRPDIRFLRQF